MRRHLAALEGLALLLVTLPLALWQSAFWLLVPFALLLVTQRPFDEYGLVWRTGSLRLHVVLIPLILGGYAIGHYAVAHLAFGQSFHPRLPPKLHLLIFHQLVDVALPEEFFFRGYLQTSFNRAWGRPFDTFGASWGWGLPAAALLFALCHLIYGDLGQLKVLFFGLFAGWLRERTDSIVTPIFYHAAGNVLLEFMVLSLN